MFYTLKNEKLNVRINSLGAELTSVLSDSGYEHIWQGEEWKKHAPVLFPTCGALLNGRYSYNGTEYSLEKHGFAKLCDFEAVEASDTSLTLMLKANEKTLSVYPFDFALEAKYSINAATLCASYTVVNNGKEIMPYMFGWHPAFTLWGSDEIASFYVDFNGKNELSRHALHNGPFINPVSERYSINNGKYYLNEEEIYANDTMIFTDIPTSVTLASADSNHSVKLSYSDNLPYLCIWKAPTSAARYICLEPWSDIPADGTHPEDFLTRKMSRLNPNEKETYTYTVVFE